MLHSLMQEQVLPLLPWLVLVLVLTGLLNYSRHIDSSAAAVVTNSFFCVLCLAEWLAGSLGQPLETV